MLHFSTNFAIELQFIKTTWNISADAFYFKVNKFLIEAPFNLGKYFLSRLPLIFEVCWRQLQMEKIWELKTLKL